MQGLGSAPVSLFGNEAQKAALLPGVARGEPIAAFALVRARRRVGRRRDEHDRARATAMAGCSTA